VLKKVSVGLALVAVGFLAGSLFIGSTGTAEPDWQMGNLADVACRVGVQSTSGPYVVADILNKIADRAGIAPCTPGCEACLAKLNKATYAEFDAIPQIGPVRATALVTAQPFVVANCVDATSIETVLRAVPGIENLSRDIVKAFCEELSK